MHTSSTSNASTALRNVSSTATAEDTNKVAESRTNESDSSAGSATPLGGNGVLEGHDGDGRGGHDTGDTHAGGRKSWRLGILRGKGRRKRRETYSHTHFKVYRRRWFGLMQLVLLNVVVSWDWLTFAPVSATAAQYFNVSETAINWLSTGYLFSFIVISPVTIYTLHRGPKDSIIWSSVLLFLGNWIRYAGSRAQGGIFGVVMFGQILTGLAQPFVLAAPTKYSDVWFTESGRVSATAVASLANPLGGALAQLLSPLLGSIPSITLYIAIIATLASIPSFFIPAAPPTPPCASATTPRTPLKTSWKAITHSPPFYILLLTFGTYVASFNAFSSLLNQILYPYGYTEDEAGICGAVLILVGLLAAAITSPIVDRTHSHLKAIKLLCPLVAFSYLGMVWAPQTRTLVAPYVIAAVMGASSFSLLPIALEYLVEVTFPASPELPSTLCWVAGQLFGGIFIVIMNALKEGKVSEEELRRVSEKGRGMSEGERPAGNMFKALVFLAVVGLAVLPAVLALGMQSMGLAHGKGRLRVDEHVGSEASEGEGERSDGATGDEGRGV